MAVLQEYKCPCCGGSIAFDSDRQKMKCPYCDTEFEMETLRSYDADLKTGEDDMRWESAGGSEWNDSEADGIKGYVCQSCGGEIIADENTAATSCPYCGNPVVLMKNVSGLLRPDLVIPFKLDKDAAKDALRKHFKGKKLLPKVFSDEAHLDEIKGIYVPFWLFDAQANAKIRYRATKVRHWFDSNYSYTETRHFAVVRGGNLRFAGVPVDGSSKMPDELMESIEPFDLSQAVDFQTAYLAGYLADKYDVSSDACVGNANSRIRNSTEQTFAATVKGYSSVTKESGTFRLSDGRSRYALLPVWILTTTWREKKYLFAMNGQTGKFVGNLPVDRGAYCKWLFGLAGAVSAVALGLSYLLYLL